MYNINPKNDFYKNVQHSSAELSYLGKGSEVGPQHQQHQEQQGTGDQPSYLKNHITLLEHLSLTKTNIFLSLDILGG